MSAPAVAAGRPDVLPHRAPQAPAGGRLLALCADDFGAAPGISQGIARLAHAGRISAVSCMTASPHWRESARRLEGVPKTIDLGLHLNFTEGRPLSARLARRWPTFPSLPRLIAQAHLGLLPHSALRNEVHAQLAAFNHALGRPPDFIDGHQHVHHLPGIRRVLLDMVELAKAFHEKASEWGFVNGALDALAREVRT